MPLPISSSRARARAARVIPSSIRAVPWSRLRRVVADWVHAVTYLVAAPVVSAALVHRGQGAVAGWTVFVLMATLAVFTVRSRYGPPVEDVRS